MSLSMYQASMPVLIQRLKTLSAILKKGSMYAKAKGFGGDVLVNARLAPDMFPLSRQVQIATDMAKGAAGRLAGIDIPSYADTESSLPELQERIAKTIAFLKTVTPAQVDGTEEKLITLQLRAGSISLSGQSYLLDWALPNVYFHVTTAYNLMRHNGVELGKGDFLGIAPKAAKKAGKGVAKPARTKAGSKR